MRRSSFILTPKNVKVIIGNDTIIINGPRGRLIEKLNHFVQVDVKEDRISFFLKEEKLAFKRQLGTLQSLVRSMVLGVQYGFVKKLKIIGVGYRAFVEREQHLNLSLGFSHIIHYRVPDSVNVICPNQNEIHLKGIDKQLVGQVAAEIRSFRKPELYKGKGIRYENEFVKTKESKKK
ncbi:50S ribosomal protein L6 [Candidatus Riesia pediculischaeffi]|uniref:50S ribosomal protein L6 n=2 Tax=Candidatus Riesia pediculischaeffi TaxID=428411 RepID=A0A1V0HKH9_9ENTR|nr:50S ribosomal protein L6 [Candidatus Riesia pediculischaeffi]ARC53221.1 hypothetical protein AOQ87_00725 [Candidatus Riesia pediculischaeffi]KIE64130.1 LSU ribosomal protein L6p (L9e) [Candidatus Riesia pediculischaeffi PTSU]